MGLFSKKKEMPLASDPFSSNQPPFDLKDIPPPPQSLNEPIGAPPSAQGPQTTPMFQPELPAFDPPKFSTPIPAPPPAAAQPDFIPPAPQALSAPEPAIPKLQPEPGFELPDFDDDEIRKLEEAENAANQPPEPVPEPVITKWAEQEPEEEPERPFAEYEEPAKPERFSYPEEERPALPVGERFMELRSLFAVKEEIDELKALFRGFDESIENYASKAKLEKYHSLGNTLNNIQDKIMTIDSKLFEP